MKKWAFRAFLLLLLSAAGSLALNAWVPQKPFEEALLRAEMSESGPTALAALARHPKHAAMIYRIYGDSPAFVRAVHEVGYTPLVPIMAKCFTGGDTFVETIIQSEQLLDQLLRIRPDKTGGSYTDIAAAWAKAMLNFRPQKPEPVEPTQCGLKVINLTLAARHDFLGQFILDQEDNAVRLPGTTAFALSKQVLFSGVLRLEQRAVLGERPTLGELAMGVADVAMLGVMGKTIGGVAKAKVAAAKTAGGLAKLTIARHGVSSLALAMAPRLAKWATVGGVAYIAVKYPDVVTGYAGSVAEAVGVSPYVGKIGVWTVLLFVPLVILGNLLWMLSGAYRFCAACLRPLYRAN